MCQTLARMSSLKRLFPFWCLLLVQSFPAATIRWFYCGACQNPPYLNYVKYSPLSSPQFRKSNEYSRKSYLDHSLASFRLLSLWFFPFTPNSLLPAFICWIYSAGGGRAYSSNCNNKNNDNIGINNNNNHCNSDVGIRWRWQRKQRMSAAEEETKKDGNNKRKIERQIKKIMRKKKNRCNTNTKKEEILKQNENVNLEL